MAVTLTTIRQGTPRTSMHIVDVAASADGDTTATIPHGLGVVPESVSFVPLSAAGLLSTWIVSAINITNVVLTKSTASGSGAAPVQLRVTIQRPSGLAG